MQSPVKKHSQKKRHTKPCKFYQTKTCQLSAEECDFLHIPPSPPQAFCRYYLAGHCSNSDWCRYNHGAEHIHDSDNPGTRDATTTIVVGGNVPEPLSTNAGFSKPRPGNVNVGAIMDHTTAPDINKLAQREGGGLPSKGPDEVSTALSVPMGSMIISGVPMAPLVPVVPVAGLGTAEQATPSIPMYGIYPVMPVAHYPGYPETYYPQGVVHPVLRHPHLPRPQPSPHPSGHLPPPLFIPHAPVPAYTPSIDPGDHIYSTSPAPNATHSPKHSSEASLSSTSSSSLHTPPNTTAGINVNDFFQVQPQNATAQELRSVNRRGYPDLSWDKNNNDVLTMSIGTEDPQYAEHGHVGQQSQIRIYDDTPIVHVPPIPVGSLTAPTVFTGGVGHFGNMNFMAHGVGNLPMVGQPEAESKPRESRGLVSGSEDVSLEGKGVSTRRARSTSRSAARFKAIHYKTKPCRYFAVDGFCASGDRCTFIHDEPMSVLLKESDKALYDVSTKPTNELDRKGAQAEQKNSTTSKKEYYPVTWRVIGGGVSLSDAKSRTASEADSDYNGVGYRDTHSPGFGTSHRKSDVVPGNTSKTSKHSQKAQDLDDLSEIIFPTLAAPPPGEKKAMRIETSLPAETSASSTSPPRARATSNPPTPINLGMNYSALFASAESPD